jgi:hypothetical protein
MSSGSILEQEHYVAYTRTITLAPALTAIMMTTVRQHEKRFELVYSTMSAKRRTEMIV